MDLELAVKGLAVLTAIPVILFALWCDYYGRYLDQTVADKGDFDPAAELGRIRAGGACAMVFQAVLFLASREVRLAYPIATFGLFVAAVVVQALVQSSLERKVRPDDPRVSEEFRTMIRAIFWHSITGLAYVAVFIAFIQAGVLAGILLKASPLARTGLALLGVMAGLTIGMALNFGIGPFQLRRIYRAKRLDDAELEAKIRGFFAEARVACPELWWIQLGGDRMANALVAGFASGRGWLRPGLFLSKSLVEALSEEELRAVLMHEISHLALRHLRRRYLVTIGVIAGLIVAGGFVLLGLSAAFPGPTAKTAISPLLAALAFVLGISYLARHQQALEHEADDHTVSALGVPVEDLIEALRKTDAVNFKQSMLDQGVTPFESQLLRRGVPLGTHPMTELRIARLREKLPVADYPVILPVEAPKNKDRAA